MSATIVVIASFREGYEMHFAEYSQRVRSFLESHGGVVIRRQRVLRTLEGDDADLAMVIDFPSEHVAGTIFSSEEYRAILPLRAQVFRSFTMHVAAAGEI